MLGYKMQIQSLQSNMVYWILISVIVHSYLISAYPIIEVITFDCELETMTVPSHDEPEQKLTPEAEQTVDPVGKPDISNNKDVPLTEQANKTLNDKESHPDPGPEVNPYIFKTVPNKSLALLEECQSGMELCSTPLMSDDEKAMFSICRSLNGILQCFDILDEKCVEILEMGVVSDIVTLLQWICQQLSELTPEVVGGQGEIPEEYLNEFGITDNTKAEKLEKEQIEEYVTLHKPGYYNLADDGILYLHLACGNLTENDPMIQVLSDTTVTITAHCVNGPQKFMTSDFVHYQLLASLIPHSHRCQFNRKYGINTYTVNVTIDNYVLDYKTSLYTVTCTYDDHGSYLTKIHHIKPGVYGTKQLDSYISPVLDSSNVKLSVQNVLDQDLFSINQSMALDRKYSLFGTWIDTKSPPLGLRPVSCQVMSDRNHSYNILKAGCGDGIIFKQSEGFSIMGSSFRSPYFQGFHLSGSPVVTFRCTFAICSKVCDGSSCEINCGEPKIQITNSKIDFCTGYTFEKECIYSCNDGYQQIDDGISTCGADGIWTVPAIKCT